LIHGSVTAREAVKITGAAPSTGSKDLKSLEEAGLLESEGHGRARVFRAVEEMMAKL
jgi:Fic family protein